MTLREAVMSGVFAKAFANRQWRYLNGSDTLEWLDGPPPTQGEIEDILSGPIVPVDLSDSTNLEKRFKAVLLAAAAMSGRTPAQAKAAFKAAWDSLP